MPIEYDSIRQLAFGLGRVPAELRQELRPKILESGQVILRDMQGRASYSSRIPGAIQMKANFGARSGGLQIQVDSAAAPHARPLEGTTSRGGTFRHPVYGNRNNWVSQATRPFFFPAVNAGRELHLQNVSDAVKAALPRGFA